MKKLRNLGIVLATMLVVTACSGPATKPTTTSQNTSQAEVSTTSAGESSTTTTTQAPTVPTNTNEQDGGLVLGKPIEFSDFTLTIKEFKIVADDEGNKGLKYTYDWENTGDKSNMPFMTFDLKGFQDGVETDDKIFMANDVDLGIGQKEVRKGGKVTAEGVVDIDDMNKPLELELTESFSFSDDSYELVIEDLSKYEQRKIFKLLI